jgi:hypothetical protein
LLARQAGKVAVVACLEHCIQHRGCDQTVREFFRSTGGLEHIPQNFVNVYGLVNCQIQPRQLTIWAEAGERLLPAFEPARNFGQKSRRLA